MSPPRGSGTLAGGAHADTFEALARAEAGEISEIFRERIDKDLLDRMFPGQPHLAYFEIAANEETDTGEIVADVQKLASAGYKVDAAWLEEKTGYKFAAAAPAAPAADSQKPIADSQPEPGVPITNRDKGEMENLLQLLEDLTTPGGIANRDATQDTSGEDNLVAAASRMLAAARVDAMAPEADELREILAMEDAEEMQNALQDWMARLPDAMGRSPEMDKAWERILSAAFASGLGPEEEVSSFKGSGSSGIQNSGTTEGGDGVWRVIRGRRVFLGGTPPRVSAAKADEMLDAGFHVKDTDGNEVRFGQELKEKLGKQADGVARKELLKWAKETVRGGESKQVEVNGEKRTYYGKVFSDGETGKGLLVIVDTEDGYAFNYHPMAPHKLDRKLKNKIGLGSGEQPPPEVLKAFAPLLATSRID